MQSGARPECKHFGAPKRPRAPTSKTRERHSLEANSTAITALEHSSLQREIGRSCYPSRASLLPLMRMDENIGEAGGEEQQRRSHDSAHWRGYSALKPFAASNRIQCGHLACAARRRGDDTMTRRRQGDDDDDERRPRLQKQKNCSLLCHCFLDSAWTRLDFRVARENCCICVDKQIKALCCNCISRLLLGVKHRKENVVSKTVCDGRSLWGLNSRHRVESCTSEHCRFAGLRPAAREILGALKCLQNGI